MKQKLLIQNLGSSLGEIWNWPHTWRAKKESGHSRWGGGRFNKQGNLPSGLSKGPQDKEISTHAYQNDIVYTEALTGFRHVSIRDGLNITLFSHSESLGRAEPVGRMNRGQERGEQPPTAWVRHQR